MTFHDLRQTGQTAAAAGANLADLMRRLGHSSSVAALRYLHAVEGRDKEIAQNLSRMAQTHSLTHLSRRHRRGRPVGRGSKGREAGLGQLELPLVWPDPVVVHAPVGLSFVQAAARLGMTVRDVKRLAGRQS